jgi:hypothetical protein
MAGGIIQTVFDRKTRRLGDYFSSFMIEELKHELVIELGKELDSFPAEKSINIKALRKWLIGDN